MSLILPSRFSTNIKLSPCLKSSPKNNMWAKTNKKNQKNVRWSDSLVEVFQIPCQEKEPEDVTKKPSQQDTSMLESLLGDLLYSTGDINVRNTIRWGDSVTDKNNSSSEALQRFDLKDTGASDSNATDNSFFLEERDSDLSEQELFTFTLKPSKSLSREDVTNNKTGWQKEQVAINNLEHLLASLSVFSGEGKRYLNVMF